MVDLSDTVFNNLIGGKWQPAASGLTFKNINPADTQDVVGQFPQSDQRDAEAALAAAVASAAEWRAMPMSERAAMLTRAGHFLVERADKIAEELTREEGKPILQAKHEVLRAAHTLQFYAIQGQTLSGETYFQDDADMLVYTQHIPLGVVTVISPWNFPISIPSRKIAPALITGNTVVFKPSTDTPLSAYRLTEALFDAGIPEGVLNLVIGKSSSIGSSIITDPCVKGITFTGSTKVGEAIHRQAHFTTRLQMELGGKNPLLVMADADLDVAVNLVIKGGLALTGQACTGTGRILVDRSILDAFMPRLLKAVMKLKIGPGLDRTTDIGPLATEQQLKSVTEYIALGQREAELAVGGERLRGEPFDNGYFISPAVFTNVRPEMRIAKEEIFGPVLVVMPVDGYEEAIRIANDSEYGLSASIVTQDMRLAHRFTNEIQSGSVKVNRTTTGNLVNAPFGGLKNSSTATFRESGRVGLEFFTQTQTVYRGI